MEEAGAGWHGPGPVTPQKRLVRGESYPPPLLTGAGARGLLLPLSRSSLPPPLTPAGHKLHLRDEVLGLLPAAPLCPPMNILTGRIRDYSCC